MQSSRAFFTYFKQFFTLRLAKQTDDEIRVR